MKFSRIGSDSENSENAMEWIISWCTVFSYFLNSSINGDHRK